MVDARHAIARRYTSAIGKYHRYRTILVHLTPVGLSYWLPGNQLAIG